MAEGSYDPYSATANGAVDSVIEEGGDGVSDEGREENEGDDSKPNVVIDFKLWNWV